MSHDNDALSDREKVLLRTALVPAFLRRMRTLFHHAEGVNQRVVGLPFDRRGRPVERCALPAPWLR
jgi:hypothetical protein